MARGQAQAANNQLSLTNSVAGQQNTAANNVSGTLTPFYENELANPGYTPTQQDAITQSSMNAINTAYGSAQQQAQNRAARTNNEAGLTSTNDSLAQNRAQTMGQQAAQNEVNFANDAQKQQQEAAQGLANEYGIDEETMSKLYGLGPGTLSARAAGSYNPLQLVGNLIGAGGQLGSAAIKG